MRLEVRKLDDRYGGIDILLATRPLMPLHLEELRKPTNTAV